MTTLCGSLKVLRKRWRYREGGCETPLDDWLGFADGVVTRGVLALASMLNRGSASFAHTTECLRLAASIHIGKEKLRELLIAVGETMQATIQKGDLQPRWSAGECLVEDAKTSRIYLGSDGVKIPVITSEEKRKRRKNVLGKRRKLRQQGKRLLPLSRIQGGADQSYKEFKLVVYYSQDQTRRVVSVTRGNHESAGRIMKRDASRLKLDEVDEAIGLFDGAPWINNQIEKQGIPLRAKGLDFYHLKDNIQRTRRDVWGDDPQGKTWAGELCETFRRKGFTAGFDLLVSWRAKLRSQKKKQAADRLITYVSDRRELIGYPEFRARGWQIGSGPTEAQCKTTTRRIKGSGRRWNQKNAAAIMTIEAVYQSRLDKQFWQLN